MSDTLSDRNRKEALCFSGGRSHERKALLEIVAIRLGRELRESGCPWCNYDTIVRDNQSVLVCVNCGWTEEG